MTSTELLCLRSCDEFHFFESTLTELTANSTTHLDIGCSSGGLLAYLMSHKPEMSLSGFDYSEERLEIARRSVPNATLTSGDANEPLPYETSTFDSVSCLEVIEHLSAPGRLVSEIFRILKPGGRVFLSTPNAESVTRFVKPSAWYALDDPTHLIFFSAFTLRFLLERSGLSVVRVWTHSKTRLALYNRFVEALGLGGQLCITARKPS